MKENDCTACNGNLAIFNTRDENKTVVKMTPYYKVHNFFESCAVCGTWKEHRLKVDKEEKTLSNYDMKINFDGY